MSSPPGASFLDFFILEASEYVEQIDGLLLRASDAGPDSEALQRVSRALRGSATMAKIPLFAELASAVEGIGRSLRAGALGWDPSLKGALTAAVDDLKLLVRAARAWTPTEDQWAAKRIAELSHYIQPAPAGFTAPSPTMSGTFFVAEAMSIAAGLELLAGRPDDREAAANVLRRIRALRGVAGVRDIPALSEVVEGAEDAVHPFELGAPALSHEQISLLRAGADVLRAVASGIPSGQQVTSSTPQYRAYLSALDGMMANARGVDRVIPIADLFHDDAGPHIVERASDPPTTPGQRFRMEVVSLGEHLHRVIDEARGAQDEIQREHARGELGQALRAIRATAASFSQMAVAQTVEGHLERTGDLTPDALDAISRFAGTISPPPAIPAPVAQHSVPFRMTHAREAMAALGSQASELPVPSSAVSQAPRASGSHARVFAAMPQPAAAPPPTAAPARGLSSLDSTIAAFDSLSSERFAEPVDIGEDVVPVDALFYRGKAALDRAIELRDAIRQSGGPPPPEALEEIYELLDLARVPEPAF